MGGGRVSTGRLGGRWACLPWWQGVSDPRQAVPLQAGFRCATPNPSEGSVTPLSNSQSHCVLVPTAHRRPLCLSPATCLLQRRGVDGHAGAWPGHFQPGHLSCLFQKPPRPGARDWVALGGPRGGFPFPLHVDF